MEDALLRAQVVADTLHGKWSTLDSHSLAHLMKDIHKLDVAGLRHLLCERPAIREPIAAGASRFDAAIEKLDEPAKRPIRHYLLVVDAGAGTTDFAFFQAITPTGQMDPKYALLRGSVRMCRIAGNEIDKILRPIILNACGVDRLKYGAEDIAYAEIDLDSRIREIKRDLFTRKQLPITLRPNFNGDIKLDDLLSDSTMSHDGRELLELRRSIIASLFPPDMLATLRANALGGIIMIHVLITGGSATVPIILELSRGSMDLDGVTFRFTPIQNLPEWIDQLPRDVAQMLANVYPQSAVAIGGSTPTLPEELRDLNTPITPTRPSPPLAQGVRMSGTRI
jgi:hypothetical protein